MKWISVSKKLPETKGMTSDYVLINEKDIGIMIGYLSLIGGEIYWILKGDRGPVSNYKLKITHWMPLPEEPKIKR